MSTINVNNLSGKGGATPNLPDGAVISGVATVTNLKPTNVNVSGAVTATTFDGSLKSTGTPTLGLGVTINSSGVKVSGVLTATTFYGSGSGLTGVGETIAPWHYNPDINDTSVTVGTGIGITFNKKVEAGSGTATLKIVNAGAAGTTIQSWGVSSCTFSTQQFTMGSLVSNLLINQTYQLDIPEGFIVDSNETSYAGTAYTFVAQPANRNMYGWGLNNQGQLGQGELSARSSPTQITGGDWSIFYHGGNVHDIDSGYFNVRSHRGGSLFAWGYNDSGPLGLNDRQSRSSPTQVGSDTTWSEKTATSYAQAAAIKTDGTLWMWGYNTFGNCGSNDRVDRSSPTQIPGTTWDGVCSQKHTMATKTDGTLWTWGYNDSGQLGINSADAAGRRSSPCQVPGTTWRNVIGSSDSQHTLATKTDGTLWAWGQNNYGHLGQNNRTLYSSPVQIPGTNWSEAVMANYQCSAATKTDGTLWVWGRNGTGRLGLNAGTNAHKSSPTQIPGTNWTTNGYGLASSLNSFLVSKADGSIWAWGNNQQGELGQNNRTNYSSPVQVGSDTDWESISSAGYSYYGTKLDTTP